MRFVCNSSFLWQAIAGTSPIVVLLLLTLLVIQQGGCKKDNATTIEEETIPIFLEVKTPEETLIFTNCLLLNWSTNLPINEPPQLSISTDSLFSASALLVNTPLNITNDSSRIFQLANGTYWLRLSSNYIDTTIVKQVTINALNTDTCFNLIAPLLQTPSNGQFINNQTTIDFNWQLVPNALSYHLQIAVNNGFTAIIYDNSNIKTNHRIIQNFEPSNLYYWRVKAQHASSQSDWSSVYNFQVQ